MISEALRPAALNCLLLEGIHASAVSAFEAGGYCRIDTRPAALAGEDLMEAIAEAHFIGIRSRTRLSDAILARADKLLAIGCFCIGTNQVDLEAAARHPVFNAPFSNTRSVAELVLAEIIMLLRGIPERTRSSIAVAG